MVIEGGTYSAQVLEYDCSGDLKIKGGVFVNPADPPVRYAIFSSDRNKNDKGALADLLAEGVTFAYKDENNKETLVDVYSTAHTEEGKTVYVVSHNHGGFDENNKCECGYVCEHAVVNEDSMCTVCGKAQSEDFYPDGTLYRGMGKNNDVAELQRMLIDLRFLNDKADGIFGKKTEQAVKDYQKWAPYLVDTITYHIEGTTLKPDKKQ